MLPRLVGPSWQATSTTHTRFSCTQVIPDTDAAARVGHSLTYMCHFVDMGSQHCS